VFLCTKIIIREVLFPEMKSCWLVLSASGIG